MGVIAIFISIFKCNVCAMSDRHIYDKKGFHFGNYYYNMIWIKAITHLGNNGP
jgi:hypothetical protein